MITLRYKPLKSGKYSLYLDVFTTDSNGNRDRHFEFLKLYTLKDYRKVKNIVQEDRNTVDLAESIKRKRELELIGELNGLQVNQKTTNRSLLEYLDSYYRKTGNKTTRSITNNIMKFVGGAEPSLSDVTPEWLQQWCEFMETTVTKNSAHEYLSVLRTRLNEAVRQKIISKSPFKRFDMPRKSETKKTTMELDEVQKLIDTPLPEYPHIRYAFLFSCFSGLRISDCLALTWDEIISETDEEGRNVFFLLLHPLKTLNTSGKLLKVPLTESAVLVLNEIRDENNFSKKVFCRLPKHTVIGYKLTEWAAVAGIEKHMHFHVARHTFATLCLTYGMDIYTVSKLLGHVRLKDTEIYAKIVDEKKRMEVKKLPTL